MSEQGDAGPTFSSDLSGMKEAANELSEAREGRAIAETVDPSVRTAPTRQLSEEEQAVADGARDMFRTQMRSAVEDQLAKDGKKLTTRSAAETLAALRQFEAQTAEQSRAAQAAQESQAQQPPEPPVTVREHPAVQETLQRLSQHEATMSQAQAQYQAGLVTLQQITQANALREFPDIQSEADVQNLSVNDPPRFARFQHAAQTIAAAQAEINNTTQRQAAHQAQQFRIYAEQQDGEFSDAHPELKRDPAKGIQAARDVMSALRSVGLTDAEIGHAYNKNPFLRDARAQKFLYEAGKLFAAREKVRGAQYRPVPNVQRPGPARDPGPEMGEVESLSRRFGSELTVKQAQQLLLAKRRAR